MDRNHHFQVLRADLFYISIDYINFISARKGVKFFEILYKILSLHMKYFAIFWPKLMYIVNALKRLNDL